MDTIYPGRNIIYLDEQPESGFISTLWQWTFSATPTPHINTNVKFSRIGVIFVKYIQIPYKKLITASFKTCSVRAVEL